MFITHACFKCRRALGMQQDQFLECHVTAPIVWPDSLNFLARLRPPRAFNFPFILSHFHFLQILAAVGFVLYVISPTYDVLVRTTLIPTTPSTTPYLTYHRWSICWQSFYPTAPHKAIATSAKTALPSRPKKRRKRYIPVYSSRLYPLASRFVSLTRDILKPLGIKIG